MFGGGSGGGIYLKCRRFDGSTNGLLRANGSNGVNVNDGGGGGGRIAVWRIWHQYQGSYSVTNGAGYTTDAEVGTVFLGNVPAPGTVFTIH